jgi:S1-C subfamily serine protease
MKLTRLFVYPMLFMLFFITATTPVLYLGYKEVAVVSKEASVYKIIIEGIESGNRVGSGTGWVGVDKDGNKVIVTNAHVCVDNGTVPDPSVGELTKIRLEDGRKLTKRIFDPFNDICLAYIEGDTKLEQPLFLAKEELSSREAAMVIGHPNGGPKKGTAGVKHDSTMLPTNMFDAEFAILMGFGEQCIFIPDSLCVYLRISDTYKVEIQPGSSGSPVLNQMGEVQGMVWGLRYADNIALVVQLKELKRYLL